MSAIQTPANTQPDKWAIDYTTGRPILTYEGCSVIQDEQAHWLLALIRAQATTANGDIRRMQESMSMGQTKEAT